MEEKKKSELKSYPQKHFLLMISTFSIFNDVQTTLLLLLSHFSHVQLCAIPWTAAYQAPPSMGFSRQEYKQC